MIKILPQEIFLRIRSREYNETVIAIVQKTQVTKGDRNKNEH